MEPTDRLESWKEIAAYLGRDIRTAQRWEAAESLPVHRHQHKKRGSVFALRSEIDEWRASRSGDFFKTTAPHPEAADEPARSRRPARAALIVLALAVIVGVSVPARLGRPKPAMVNTRAPVERRLLDALMRDGSGVERIPVPANANQLALSPDGKTLFAVICADDGMSGLRAIQVTTRLTLWHLDGFGGCPPILLNPRGDRIFIADNSDIVVVEAATRRQRRIPTPAASIRDFALARNGRTLFIAALFQGLLEVDLVSGQVQTTDPLPCPVSLASVPRGDRLYVGYQCSGPGGRRGHDAIAVVDVATGKRVGSIKDLPNVGGDLAVSPDGSSLWADGADACRNAYDNVGCPAGSGSIINVIDTVDGLLLRSLRVGGAAEQSGRLSFTPDGNQVVAGNFETNVLDARSLKAVEAMPVRLWSNVVFSPDGRTAYASIDDKLSIAVVPVTELSAPLAGLIARWTADGVHDDSAGGNDVPRDGQTSFGPGRIGRSLVFSGGKSLRLTEPGGLGLAGQFTAMTWVRMEQPDTILEYAANSPEGQFGWAIFIEEDGRPAFCIGPYERGECKGVKGAPRDSVGGASAPGRVALRPGSWHHLAITRLNAQVTLSLDGREVAAVHGVAGGFPVAEVLFLRFGSDEAGARPFRGSLDEIEVYNRALSAAEVAARGK